MRELRNFQKLQIGVKRRMLKVWNEKYALNIFCGKTDLVDTINCSEINKEFLKIESYSFSHFKANLL